MLSIGLAGSIFGHHIIAVTIVWEDKVPISFDGFYKARFTALGGESGGVMMLQGGKVCGGNSELVITGSYTSTPDGIRADLTTTCQSVQTSGLLKDDLVISLNGRGGLSGITCIGSSPQLPGVELKVVLDRVHF